MKRTMTTSQVADELGLSASAVQKYARNGDIPFETTPGGHRRYDLAEVAQALYPPKSALQPLDLDGSLGAGAPVESSRAARLQRDARSTVAAVDDARADDAAGTGDALTELFDRARRVLVSTGA